MSDSKKLLRPFVLYLNLKKGKIKSTKSAKKSAQSSISKFVHIMKFKEASDLLSIYINHCLEFPQELDIS